MAVSALSCSDLQPAALDELPSEVPELLRVPLLALAPEARSLAMAFFEQRPERSGPHELVLSTETRRGESGEEVAVAHVVLKLDFDAWSWKRVRRKLVGSLHA